MDWGRFAVGPQRLRLLKALGAAWLTAGPAGLLTGLGLALLVGLGRGQAFGLGGDWTLLGTLLLYGWALSLPGVGIGLAVHQMLLERRVSTARAYAAAGLVVSVAVLVGLGLFGERTAFLMFICAIPAPVAGIAGALVFWKIRRPDLDTDPVLGSLRGKLEAAYAEPQRHYHTLVHIEDCLARLNALHGLDPREMDALRWAIWWHDVVYDPTRTDNEALSAEMAERDLSALGADPAVVREVSRMIRLTAGHAVESGDRLGALMVSIDLSILGAEPHLYDRYADEIRREYAFVPEDAYGAGRIRVLQGFLDAEAIYPNPAFHERFETTARANLAREIAMLGQATAHT